MIRISPPPSQLGAKGGCLVPGVGVWNEAPPPVPNSDLGSLYENRELDRISKLVLGLAAMHENDFKMNIYSA